MVDSRAEFFAGTIPLPVETHHEGNGVNPIRAVTADTCGPENLRQEWFADRQAVGVTAGASAPELLVQQVVERLRSWGGTSPQVVVGREENVVFSLPRALRVSRTA